jgi:hypothetical protein
MPDYQTEVDALRKQLADLHEQEKSIKSRIQTLTAERTLVENLSAVERLLAKPDKDFYAEHPRHDVRPYILPFGSDYKRFNPRDDADREGHDFGPRWTTNTTAIICKKDERTRPTRLIWTSSMSIGEADKIGQRFLARHDQTGGKLGEYEIVGLAFFGADAKLVRTVGDVPSVKFAQSTYK